MKSSLSQKTKYSFFQIILLGLFLLISMNFANLYFYLVFVAFFICFVANLNTMKMDIVFIFLMLFSICYAIFYGSLGDTYKTIMKQFVYPMCYFVGLNLFSNKKKTTNAVDANNQVAISVYVVAIGALIHFVLNAWTNRGSENRNTIDFWTKEVSSATGQALLAVLALSVFATWLFQSKGIKKKLLAFSGLGVIFAYNLILAGRTILILALLVIALAYFYAMKSSGIAEKARKSIFVILAVLAVAVMFFNNTLGIQDMILGSNLSNRFDNIEMLEDTRIQLKLRYLTHMFEYPMGGNYLRPLVDGYAHELYLDAYNDVGIIGYLLVILVVISCTYTVVKLIRSRNLSSNASSLLLCAFFAMNIVFFLEPILQGAPWLFCLFCFLSGIAKSINTKKPTVSISQ